MVIGGQKCLMILLEISGTLTVRWATDLSTVRGGLQGLFDLCARRVLCCL